MQTNSAPGTQAGLVDGLTVVVGMAELLRQTLRSLRDEAPSDPPLALALGVGVAEAAAAAAAAGLTTAAVTVEAAVTRLPGPLRSRARSRITESDAWRHTAVRGAEVLAAGREETARIVSNGIDAILPWISEQLVPRLLDSMRPYLAQEVVPPLIDDLMPYLTEELIPKVVVEIMPTLRSDILPVVIADLAASEELRDLIREQSQGFVREASDEVKVRTRNADDALEDRLRRFMRLRVRESDGPDAGSRADTPQDSRVP